MVDFTIKFFGIAVDPAVNANKIWGWVEIEGKLYNFWGRRGTVEKQKAISFKRSPNTWEGNHALRRLTEKKMHPNGNKTPYVSIPLNREGDVYIDVDHVYPEFSKHFRKELMLFRLSGDGDLG